MRYIKPPDFKSVIELEKCYKKVEADIRAMLSVDASPRTAQELNDRVQSALNATVQYLTVKNKNFAQTELPIAFDEGNAIGEAEQKRSKQEVAQILASQGYKYAKNGFSNDVYIELQAATKSAGDGFKTALNSIIERLSLDGKDSVYNVQKEVEKYLNDHKIFEVKYANGAKMPLHAYAAMAARSARIETVNIAAIGRALQSGTDLVKMTTMPGCCKLCAAYQGKVYSISGQDKRFPALFKTVLRNGYALPHPNCRHEFIAYYEYLEDPKDVERMIKASKIKYDHQGNLVDVRFQKDIEAYAAWQVGNRQLNREMLEYGRMREYYKGREEEMPYKSLGTFRTARRSNNLSPAFKKWKYRNADKNQYERWKEIIGEEEMPKTLDDFQEIKYNKGIKETFTHLENVFQGYSVYKRANPEATPRDYRTALKLKEQGTQGTIQIPAQIIDTKDYSFRDDHVNSEHKRNLTRENAEDVIKNSIVSIVQWKGQRVLYYSQNGATVIDKKTKEIITTWDSSDFDESVKNIIKEILSDGKK